MDQRGRRLGQILVLVAQDIFFKVHETFITGLSVPKKKEAKMAMCYFIYYLL